LEDRNDVDNKMNTSLWTTLQ